MKKIVTVLAAVLLLSACNKEPQVEPVFQRGEKVCYVDDSTLTGRVMRISEYSHNKFQYRVQWRITNTQVSGGILGAYSSVKPFAWVWHCEWELKFIKE